MATLYGRILWFFVTIEDNLRMYKIINKKKLVVTAVLDSIGKILFFFPRLFLTKRELPPGNLKSILVIRTAYIGDVVMTLPILKPLKKRFPEAEISFLTSRSAAPLLQNNPNVDETIVYDAFWFYSSNLAHWFRFIRAIRKKRYDLVIEARADIRDIALVVFFCKAGYKVSYGIGGGSYLLTHEVPYPGLTHKVDYHLNLVSYLGCSLEHSEGGICLRDTERQLVGEVLADNGVKHSFIAVHPGSRLFLKRWPLDRCAALCDKLIETYQKPLVFVGAPAETELVESILNVMTHKPVSLAGKLSLRELAAVLERAEVFVCNDSAPMHIAAAMKTKTVAIFGPSKSKETGPYNTICRVVERDLACRSSCDESRCRARQFHACMVKITEEDVFSAVSELITD